MGLPDQSNLICLQTKAQTKSLQCVYDVECVYVAYTEIYRKDWERENELQGE